VKWKPLTAENAANRLPLRLRRETLQGMIAKSGQRLRKGACASKKAKTL
jgi:hypothetical protein